LAASFYFDAQASMNSTQARCAERAARLRQPTKPRANIILRCVPILASTLLSLFAVDSVAKPLKVKASKSQAQP
jgi:hypothetical protein